VVSRALSLKHEKWSFSSLAHTKLGWNLHCAERWPSQRHVCTLLKVLMVAKGTPSSPLVTPKRPVLTLTTFWTLVGEYRKQFSLRKSQIMLTALRTCPRKSLLGWRKSLMNLSRRWLGVMKSGAGWGLVETRHETT
jgi:hypothetical protein